MKKENVEQKVDRLLRRHDNSSTRYRTRHSKKMLKGSVLPMVLLVSALLISGALFTGFYVGTQKGDIELVGGSSIYFDGAMVSAETFSIPMDVTTLVAGDSFSFAHRAESVGGTGDWDMSFDVSAVTGFDPANEWFGFYFDIVDGDSISIVNELIYLNSGNGFVDFDFTYALDPNYLTPALNLLPYSVDVLLVSHVNLPPVAGDDVVSFVHDGVGTVAVLDNDFDFEDGNDLDIISADQTIPLLTVTIEGTFPDEYLSFTTGSVGVYHVDYVIEDEGGLTDIGTVTVTVT